MSLSLYDASVPGVLRMLNNLSAMLDKAEAHAQEKGVELSSLAEARLADDMHPLTRQIQMASDSAKGAGARLAGIEAPSFPDVETTFPELKERIARTVAFLQGLEPEQLNDDSRTIEIKLPSRTLTFTARDYLFQFALPNFYFHVVTAYGVLRSRGVPLGKMDYLAGPQFAG